MGGGHSLHCKRRNAAEAEAASEKTKRWEVQQNPSTHRPRKQMATGGMARNGSVGRPKKTMVKSKIALKGLGHNPA